MDFLLTLLESARITVFLYQIKLISNVNTTAQNNIF